MITDKYLSLGLLLLIVACLVCSKRAGQHPLGSMQQEDNGSTTSIQVKSSLHMSMMLLILENANEAITTSTTHSPPTTTRTQSTQTSSSTQRPSNCEIDSCYNGGTLQQSNGSCPICQCAPDCSGNKCESCVSASTSTLSTTSSPAAARYNCSVMPCYNGATKKIGSNGSCWCNCRFGYQGDLCEYRQECSFDFNLNCSNGGTPTYSPSMGGCACSCPSSCYYGSNCEYYDENCNPSSSSSSSTQVYTTRPTCSNMNCLVHRRKLFYSNDTTQCQCACLHGYTGQYCELFNSLHNLVICYESGTPYYDPASNRVKCTCLPRYHGSRCQYFDSASLTPIPIARYNCSVMPCLNGATKEFDSNGSCWCKCAYGYQGEFCEESHACFYIYNVTCSNGGSPTYNPTSTTCVCSCPSCYYGSKCEYYDSNCNSSSSSLHVNQSTTYVTTQTTTSKVVAASCSTLYCWYGGVVSKSNGTTECECACYYAFSGQYCELVNTLDAKMYCTYGGFAYYDLASRTIKCSCWPNYYGDKCLHSADNY